MFASALVRRQPHFRTDEVVALEGRCQSQLQRVVSSLRQADPVAGRARQTGILVPMATSTRDDLLVALAEADAAHRPEREHFFLVETFGGTTIGHPALTEGEIG